MQMFDLESKMQTVVRQIVSGYTPEKVILFGSFAWGEPGPDSDIDLLIVKNTDKPFFERTVAVRNIINGAFPVDVLVRTPMEVQKRLALGDPFYVKIVREGKYLYGGK